MDTKPMTDPFGVSKGLPPYAHVKGIGRVKVNFQHSKDLFDVTDSKDARRLVPRHRLTFVKSKPISKPKWVQGELFKADAFGVSKVLKKEGEGYAIYSNKGKRLAKPMPLEAAKKRLRQIEYFKHKKA